MISPVTSAAASPAPPAPAGNGPNFWLFSCQVGAEQALKQELAREHTELRFSYSRPGFLTFKEEVAAGQRRAARWTSVFARTQATSLGKARGASTEERIANVWRMAGSAAWNRVHVWQRDARPAGDHGYEPQPSLEAAALESALRSAAPAEAVLAPSLMARPADVQGAPPVVAADPADLGELVLDCVLVSPEEWWIGWHRVSDWVDRWPGGLQPVPEVPGLVSRAYHKMQAALGWSGLPIKPGERFAEIGCAPGGSSQALLERGLLVLGIDPAEVHPAIAANPNFQQIRKRGHEVRRREFRRVRWLAADMNVAPAFTLETVEAIVTHAETEIRGLLLTLKLPDWNLALEIPQWFERVRGWGFRRVEARQLQHHRREICLAAQSARRRQRR